MVVLALAALAVFALAILLRVACHFCGVTIPALGRAYFTAAASVGLTLVAAYFILEVLQGARGFTPGRQVTAWVLMLIANGAISTVAYAPLLEVRLARAFHVWLVQAVVFLALGLFVGCCAGVGSLLR